MVWILASVGHQEEAHEQSDTVNEEQETEEGQKDQSRSSKLSWLKGDRLDEMYSSGTDKPLLDMHVQPQGKTKEREGLCT